MQKEIRNKILILSMFVLVFAGFGVLMLVSYTRQKNEALLFAGLLFIFIGLCAAFFLIKMIEETKLIKEKFYKLSESVGDELILERAEKLQRRLDGVSYKVQTNDKGFRVIEELDEKQLSKLENGRKVYVDGYHFFKTALPNKYKELSVNMEYSKVDGKIIEKPLLVGGRSFSFGAHMTVERDKNGKIITTSTGLKNHNVLQEVISESKSADGWKTSLDAESKFALIMAIIGGGGAILTGLLHLYLALK